MVHEHHNNNNNVSGQRLFWTILLNAGITVAELIGGIISGSMSLISDAVHNFSDVLALIISYIANRLTRKTATEEKTYGYRRSEILAAFINSATLIVLAVFILYQAVMRFFEPVEIAGDLVIWLAASSIAVNGLSVLFIHRSTHGNMNMRSAYLHLFGDMLTSVAVLAGGLLMKFYQIYWIDALLSILIAIYLLQMSWGIFKSSLQIIMQFTPTGIDLKTIAKEVEQIRGIKNIHHIHIWQIDEHNIMFEAHVDLATNENISGFEKILDRIKILLSKYHIEHITIQPEYEADDCKEIIHNLERK